MITKNVSRGVPRQRAARVACRHARSLRASARQRCDLRDYPDGAAACLLQAKLVEPTSFVDVRAGGRSGDFTCDGWHLTDHVCYAVYAPFSRKSAAQVRQVLDDFQGALRSWPQMRAWQLVHNDMFGLSAPVAKALVDVEAAACDHGSGVVVRRPWGPSDLWQALRALPPKVRDGVLGPNPWGSAYGSTSLGLDRFADDPVQTAVGRSVAHLIGNFPVGGVADPMAALALAGVLASVVLEDDRLFRSWLELFERRSTSDPFETMLWA